MADQMHLYYAFLDAHRATGNLAGTWNAPRFGETKDERATLEKIRVQLRRAASHIGRHLSAEKDAA